MTTWGSEPITGWAAGVPFTALPPHARASAPLIVTWHMMDAPRSDAAFAAALPLPGVPAWRVHLGLPTVGRRPVEGAFEAARADPMMRYIDPLVRQASDEFPAALAALREQFPISAGPIGLVGGSLGGNVALNVVARQPAPIAAVALVNPAIRARSAVEIFDSAYAWSEESRAAADRLDFVAQAGLITGRGPQPALLVVSGELDYPVLRNDAFELLGALRAGYARPDRVRLTTVPGLGHPLAERPGLEPAPQIPPAKLVDDEITDWFRSYLG
jgi:dienelactone hydrolase